MKLLITTQVYENYGAHDWDSKGECPQYWKAKGGNDYFVPNIDINAAVEIFDEVKSLCESNNDYFHEYTIGWEVVADDYLTEYEKFQLEYEGKVIYPSKEIAWVEKTI